CAPKTLPDTFHSRSARAPRYLFLKRAADVDRGRSREAPRGVARNMKLALMARLLATTGVVYAACMDVALAVQVGQLCLSGLPSQDRGRRRAEPPPRGYQRPAARLTGGREYFAGVARIARPDIGSSHNLA